MVAKIEEMRDACTRFWSHLEAVRSVEDGYF